MKSFTMKLLLGVASAATLFTTAALADDAPPPWGTFSGYVDVASDYRFRGISQSNRQPSPEASINWSGPEGFYAGTWEAKTDWVGYQPFRQTPSFEADFYAGKHTDLDGTDLNVEAYYYSYPDYVKNYLGPKSASYYETIVQLAHTFDALTVTATGAWSPRWSLVGSNGYYVEGTASYAATDWLSISGNVGHQWVDLAKSFGSTDYTHWDLGGTATYKSWALDVRYVDTSLNKSQCGFYMITKNACEPTVVATLTYNISSLF
ncbi:MAG TPA: TorF family putative porin [Rhizomicrobium sp.]|nr:TorF family putative porin [Rhizomicrobium sp.]